MNDNKKVSLGGLWTKETKAGDKYLSGKLNFCYLNIFKNKFKKKDSDPDWVMTLTQPEKKEAPKTQQTFDESNDINM